VHKVIHRNKDLELGKAADSLAAAADRIRTLTRRRLLKGALAAGGLAVAGPLAGPLAWADEAVKTGQFIFPRLKFSVLDNTPDIWNVGPVGDANLRKKLQELTNINVSTEPKIVQLADFEDMVRNPFVFMTSEGFFKLPDNEERNLREFLERGGFVHADDCVFGGREDRFFRTYVDLINSLFPGGAMRQIPDEHELFHIYYDMSKENQTKSKTPSPHLQGVDHGAWGLFERGTGRIMTVATSGDLHCGWMNRYWGMGHTMSAIKMGVNIIIYFLSH
jgi:hypothetical protein